jgi:hypothetical protein
LLSVREISTDRYARNSSKCAGFKLLRLVKDELQVANRRSLTHPTELEGHLLAHTDVADVGVVGIADEFSGEVRRCSDVVLAFVLS